MQQRSNNQLLDFFLSLSRDLAKQGSQSQVRYPIFGIGFWCRPINAAKFFLPLTIKIKQCPVDDKQGSRRYIAMEKTLSQKDKPKAGGSLKIPTFKGQVEGYSRAYFLFPVCISSCRAALARPSNPIRGYLTSNGPHIKLNCDAYIDKS